MPMRYHIRTTMLAACEHGCLGARNVISVAWQSAALARRRRIPA